MHGSACARQQSELKADIELALEAFLDGSDPEIDAYSISDYDIENLEPALQYWSPDPDAGPKIVKADSEVIVFVLTVNALVNFCATFCYSVHDSVDRDMVSLGTDTKEVEEKLQLQVVISVDRRIDEEPHVRSVEVEARRFTISFGSIDPDWGVRRALAQGHFADQRKAVAPVIAVAGRAYQLLRMASSRPVHETGRIAAAWSGYRARGGDPRLLKAGLVTLRRHTDEIIKMIDAIDGGKDFAWSGIGRLGSAMAQRAP
jgi:hypothetical protein